jgi:hypothetical protein
MFFELVYGIGHIATIDVVAVEYAASLPSTYAHDQIFRNTATAHIPGTSSAQIMEQKLGYVRSDTSAPPRHAEILDRLAIASGKDVVIGLLAFNQCTEQLKDRTAHDYFPALAVLGRTRLKSDHAL